MEAWSSAVSWLAVKLFISRAWAFLKDYWQIPFMVLWTIITVLLARRNTQALKDVLTAKQKSHKEQVESLKKNHKEEVLKLKKIQKEYVKALEELEVKFDEQNQRLSEKHIEDVKEIVVKSKGNPQEIKRKIENEFGIKFTN